ncbi:MAG: hypothetical protein ACYCTB_10095 [bacterium]
MLKSKKLFMVLFMAAGLMFFFISTQTAFAKNGIFISTLSKIPGYKIVKDFGLEYTGNYSHFHYIITSVSDNAPAGANACINLKFVSEGSWPKSNQYSSIVVYTPSEVGVCDYVKLVPKK